MTVLLEHIDLPVLHPDAASLLLKFQHEDVVLQDIVGVLELDATLTAKVLRLSNSPFFAMGGKISNVQEAVWVIGLSNTRNVVIAEMVMGRFKEAPWNQMDLKKFWVESLTTACCAQLLAQQCSVLPAQAYCVGLLHRLGVMVMMAALGSAYTKLWMQALPIAQLLEAEFELAGTTHAQVGAQILRRWHLPESLAFAVEHQYSLLSLRAENGLSLVLSCALQLSGAVVLQESVAFDRVKNDLAEKLCLNERQIDQLLRAVQASHQSLVQMVQDE